MALLSGVESRRAWGAEQRRAVVSCDHLTSLFLLYIIQSHVGSLMGFYLCRRECCLTQSSDTYGCTDHSRRGKNAAESLEDIILRYRLDGIDVDFEGFLTSNNYQVFTSALCTLFSALRDR